MIKRIKISHAQVPFYIYTTVVGLVYLASHGISLDNILWLIIRAICRICL